MKSEKVNAVQSESNEFHNVYGKLVGTNQNYFTDI